MNTPELRERPAELLPLTAVTTRQEAMERCIGPLGNLVAIQNIERFMASPRDTTAQASADYYDPNRGSLKKDVVIEAQYRLNRDLGVTSKIDLTALQQYFMVSYTFACGLPEIIEETLGTQAEIIGNIVLPAYFAAQQGSITTQQALDLMQIAPMTKIADTLQHPDFQQTLRNLSFSANGAYAANRGGESPEDVFRHLQRSIKDQTSKPQRPIGLHEVCTRREDGSVIVSTIARTVLSNFMKYDNKYGIYNSIGNIRGRHGSRGCPASMTTVRVHPDDLTSEQWDQLLGGYNPVAAYDEQEQKLTTLRNPIYEASDLLADQIRKIAQLIEK